MAEETTGAEVYERGTPDTLSFERGDRLATPLLSGLEIALRKVFAA